MNHVKMCGNKIPNKINGMHNEPYKFIPRLVYPISYKFGQKNVTKYILNFYQIIPHITED